MSGVQPGSWGSTGEALGKGSRDTAVAGGCSQRGELGAQSPGGAPCLQIRVDAAGMGLKAQPPQLLALPLPAAFHLEHEVKVSSLPPSQSDLECPQIPSCRDCAPPPLPGDQKEPLSAL